jgi:hypothetical protein
MYGVITTTTVPKEKKFGDIAKYALMHPIVNKGPTSEPSKCAAVDHTESNAPDPFRTP